MKLQAIVIVMMISCLSAGCTEAEVENVEKSLGCTYTEASNYNVSAAIDDGSCVYPEPPVPDLGCMYSDALNYNPSATEDDGSCRYPVVDEPIPGCTYLDAYNYDENSTEDDGSCIYDTDGDGIIDDFEESGCTDANANNHNSSSTDDDGSCDYDKDDDGVYDWAEADGCLDANATNFDAGATESNQTMCEYPYVMTLGDLESFLEDADADGASDGLDTIIVDLGNVTAFLRVIDVAESTEENGELGGDSNANTTSVEVIFGHDPINEIVYESMVIRFMGDISMEQTTVQGPDGINYRIGSTVSGSWYYARDEVYQYENPFQEDDGDEGGSTSEDDEGEDGSLCDEFFDDDPFNWPDNWTLSHDNGVNTAEGRNETRGLDARLELVGSPPNLSLLEISQFNGMARCSIEILETSVIDDIAIDTSLPRTSMTMKIENELEEDSGSTKTWSAELSEEHFEEVNLTEIVILVFAGEEESEEGEGSGDPSLVTSMLLSEQTSTHTDQCYQWTLSWADNDNDGYTSEGDAYTITRTEKVIDPCPDDDEYRNKDFQIVFYDLWADMPTGGVFTPGFSLFSAISTLLASSMFIGRRGVRLPHPRTR
jgi:hypothetical protein